VKGFLKGVKNNKSFLVFLEFLEFLEFPRVGGARIFPALWGLENPRIV